MTKAEAKKKAKFLNSIPKVVRIGHTDYAIKTVKNLEINGKSKWGSFHTGTGQIELDEGFLASAPISQIIEVILHEIIHGVHNFYAEDLKLSEETVVMAYGKGMTILIRDNPKLFNWILKHL